MRRENFERFAYVMAASKLIVDCFFLNFAPLQSIEFHGAKGCLP